MSAERATYWQAPSGRIHRLRMCSGGAAYRNVKVRLTAEQYAAANRCRCCEPAGGSGLVPAVRNSENLRLGT